MHLNERLLIYDERVFEGIKVAPNQRASSIVFTCGKPVRDQIPVAVLATPTGWSWQFSSPY